MRDRVRGGDTASYGHGIATVASRTGQTAASVVHLAAGDLAETINRKMGFSRAESLDLVEEILAKMCGAMADGENVKISGFGSFILRDKRERIGRNPKTGIEVPITPRRVMTFRASQLLKERIAKG